MTTLEYIVLALGVLVAVVAAVVTLDSAVRSAMAHFASTVASDVGAIITPNLHMVHAFGAII